jgi:hypothetical protein
VAVPAVLAAPLAAGSLPRAAWGVAFDETMDALVPCFVNHLDHGGDWAELALAAVAPRWTAESVLAALGGGERWRVGAGRLCVAGWAEQQYALLNLLRWTRPTPTVAAQTRAGQGATHAAAGAAYAAATWTAAEVLPGGAAGNLFAEAGGEVAPVEPSEAYAVFARRPVLHLALTASLAHRLTIYGRASRRADERGGGSLFEDPWFGLAEATTGKVLEESAGQAAASRAVALPPGDDLVLSEPAPGETRGLDFSGPADGLITIARWDGPGGFHFLS